MEITFTFFSVLYEVLVEGNLVVHSLLSDHKIFSKRFLRNLYNVDQNS